MAVERDVRPDKVFMGRVQAAADRPLILIADDDRGAQLKNPLCHFIE